MTDSESSQSFVEKYLRLREKINELNSELENTLGLSWNDFLVLKLAKSTPLTQKQLAAKTGLSQAGVSKIVFRLLTLKLIEINILDIDRRANIILLTAIGDKKLDLADRVVLLKIAETDCEQTD